MHDQSPVGTLCCMHVHASSVVIDAGTLARSLQSRCRCRGTTGVDVVEVRPACRTPPPPPPPLPSPRSYAVRWGLLKREETAQQSGQRRAEKAYVEQETLATLDSKLDLTTSLACPLPNAVQCLRARGMAVAHTDRASVKRQAARGTVRRGMVPTRGALEWKETWRGESRRRRRRVVVAYHSP